MFRNFLDPFLIFLNHRCCFFFFFLCFYRVSADELWKDSQAWGLCVQKGIADYLSRSSRRWNTQLPVGWFGVLFRHFDFVSPLYAHAHPYFLFFFFFLWYFVLPEHFSFGNYFFFVNKMESETDQHGGRSEEEFGSEPKLAKRLKQTTRAVDIPLWSLSTIRRKSTCQNGTIVIISFTTPAYLTKR